MEYMSGASLNDIIEYIGNPGEILIQKIAYQLLIALNDYYQLAKEEYKDLIVSDILFDKQGNLKVK